MLIRGDHVFGVDTGRILRFLSEPHPESNIFENPDPESLFIFGSKVTGFVHKMFGDFANMTFTRVSSHCLSLVLFSVFQWSCVVVRPICASARRSYVIGLCAVAGRALRHRYEPWLTTTFSCIYKGLTSWSGYMLGKDWSYSLSVK